MQNYHLLDFSWAHLSFKKKKSMSNYFLLLYDFLFENFCPLTAAAAREVIFWTHFCKNVTSMSHAAPLPDCVTLRHAFWSMLSIRSCSLITCLLGLLSSIYFISMHQSMYQFFGRPRVATTSRSTECPQEPLFQALSTSPQYVHVHNKC